MDKLLIIDGFNLLSRSYFATAYGKPEEKLSKTSSGLYNNALPIFFRKMFQLIKQNEITHCAVAWDVSREETVRRQEYEFYKATRNALPGALIEQYETLRKALEKMYMKQLIIPPYEADDIIGSLSEKWSNLQVGDCYIYSNDKDLYQLLKKNVKQIISGKKGEKIYSLNEFEKQFQIHPKQWVEVKALLGDASDNIPGCKGIGEKSALPLIQHFGSIENMYSKLDSFEASFKKYQRKLLTGKDMVYVSKRLAAIDCEIQEIRDLKIESLVYRIEKDITDEIFMELELMKS